MLRPILKIGNFEGANAFGNSLTAGKNPIKLKLVWGTNKKIENP